ncbi:ArnT family glycosyltransferase [Desulfoluna spongiiphila]|uniref:Dolichyl-phosphate-mannose-protein mannosyltransferase n=1 Tax=Desulfoluna spongiiphila TaxID=419481 RepID=A0A1G5IJ10_9BACT|nr:glycosyltransferase family 39 protein [Desulfoluna spongiiphila]SCY75549.1 Dolichyl-phosphate-mannose-protein mannosyltransferase [Desulfoluna spongiiphila]
MLNMIRKRIEFFFILFAIFVLFTSFYLRIKVINETVINRPIRADAKGYYFYAMNVKQYGVYSRQEFSSKKPIPDALCSPGFPMSILPFVTFPPSIKMVWDIQRMQVLLGCATVILAYLIAQPCIGRWMALLAAFLTGISPHLVSCTTYILTETLFTFLMVLFLWIFMQGIQHHKNWLLCLAGITLGLASLTRPTLQYFIFALIPLAFVNKRRSVPLKHFFIVFLFFVSTMAPWFVRNYQVTGQLSDSRLMVSTLHHGIYPDFTYNNDPKTKGFPYRFDPDINNIAKDMDSVINEIKRRFANEPYRHAYWYLIKKPLTLLSWDILAGMGDVFVYPVIKSPYLAPGWIRGTHRVMKALHGVILTLSLLATVVAWVPHAPLARGKTEAFVCRLLSLIMLYFIALHVVGAPFPRYGVPLRPIMYIQALMIAQMIGIFWLQKGKKHKGQGDEQIADS